MNKTFKRVLVFNLVFVYMLLAGQGQIGVSSDVSGAYIYVDGVKKSMTGEGFSNILLDEGEYSIQVQKLSENEEWLYSGSKKVFVGSDTSIKIKINTKKQATQKRTETIRQEQNFKNTPKNFIYRDRKGNNFVKLNQKGKSLDISAKKWSCVEDTRNELYWEVKTNDNSIRDYKKEFRWGGKSTSGVAYRGKKDNFENYEADKNTAVTNYHEGKYYSDWDSLIDYANKEALCGFTNWRVPTIFELHSLSTYYSQGENQKIQTWKSAKSNSKKVYTNPTFFPTITKLKSPWYWSSSPYVDYSDYAWRLGFFYGSDNDYYRGKGYYVRLVAE